MKKYFTPVLLLSVLAIGGCSASKNVNTNFQNTNQPQDQKSSQAPEKITNENFFQGSLTDLEIGKKVMVMGKQNTDGTIIANQIIIANSDTDFSQFGPNRNRQPENNAQENPQGGNQQPGGEAGSRPNFQNLSEEERAELRTQRSNGQNLTDEQRAQMREQMGNKPPNAGNRQMNRSMAHLNGEITAKDDTSITLKLQDGSAKLVFVSDATSVDIIKQAI